MYYYHPRGGTPVLARGNPPPPHPARTGLGYPPPKQDRTRVPPPRPGQNWGPPSSPPPPPGTGYATGGMPLAVSRRRNFFLGGTLNSFINDNNTCLNIYLGVFWLVSHGRISHKKTYFWMSICTRNLHSSPRQAYWIVSS